MKKGFTLQEALITLAIVGVVSAIVLPSVQKLLPDENKLKYIKAYNTLTNLTSDILNDSTYYYREADDYDANGNPTCDGLNCGGYPRDNTAMIESSSTWQKNNIIDISTKFPYIMASKLSLQNNVACELIPGEPNMTRCFFATTDGISWRFINNFNNSAAPVHSVMIDVAPSGGTLREEFSSARTIANIDNPEQFTFQIANDGTITATDELGQEYLKDSSNMHNTQAVKNTIRKKYTQKESGDKKSQAESEKAYNDSGITKTKQFDFGQN